MQKNIRYLKKVKRKFLKINTTLVFGNFISIKHCTVIIWRCSDVFLYISFKGFWWCWEGHGLFVEGRFLPVEALLVACWRSFVACWIFMKYDRCNFRYGPLLETCDYFRVLVFWVNASFAHFSSLMFCVKFCTTPFLSIGVSPTLN